MTGGDASLSLYSTTDMNAPEKKQITLGPNKRVDLSTVVKATVDENLGGSWDRAALSFSFNSWSSCVDKLCQNPPQPTAEPTANPTHEPSQFPTPDPTILPGNPTPEPTALPTQPTFRPSQEPTMEPTHKPSVRSNSIVLFKPSKSHS